MRRLKNFELFLYSVLVFLWPKSFAFSQDETGLPYIRNYTPKEYGGAPQNWDATQDTNGVMYFANSDGVLRYDGVFWKKIVLPNFSLARSVAADSLGMIYVGGYGEIGYLQPDSIGVLHFISLIDRIPEAKRSFGDVWKIFVVKENVYFVTNSYVFRWNKHNIRSWQAESKFGSWYIADNRLFVLDEKIGLKTVIKDSLELVEGGDKFANKNLFDAWPFHRNAWVYRVPNKGFLIDNGKSVKTLYSNKHRLILESIPHYNGLIQGDRYVITTLREGVFILDSNGIVIQVINKETGLQSNDVKRFYCDKDGNFWLLTNSGISRVSIPSPASFFNERLQLTAAVDAIIRKDNILYAATNYGVRKLQRGADASEHPFFEEIPGNKELALHLLTTGNDLLAATGDGVFLIRNRATRVTSHRSAFLYRSIRDTNLIYVGLKEGLDLLQYRNGTWSDAGLFPGITEQIRSIAEDPEGNLWLGTRSQGVLKLTLNIHDPFREVHIQRFDVKDGLPPGGVRVARVSGKMYFSTDERLMRFDEPKEQFIPDSTFGVELSDGSHAVDQLYEDSRGNVWAIAVRIMPEKNTILFAELQKNGAYHIEKNVFEQFSEFPVWYVYPDRDGVVWFGGPDGIIRYDQKIHTHYNAGFSTIISGVFIRNDSLIYAGNLTHIPKIQFDDNAMRIQFAGACYEDELASDYQYKLKGFDKDWSGWSKEKHKDYTNIPEGRYQFYVRTRNVHGYISAPAVFEFVILPPWYRTWWAYSIYGVMLFMIAHVGVKIRFRFLEYRNRQLEIKVEARTLEIQKQRSEIYEKNLRLESANSEIEAQRDHLQSINAQLESAIKELKETQQQLVQSEKMASVGHMVAGIAHEINNPLTFINPNLEYVGTQINKLLRIHEAVQPYMKNKTYDKESFAELLQSIKPIVSEVDKEEIISSINATISGGNRIKAVVANLRTFTGHDTEDVIETNIQGHLNNAIDLFFNQYHDIEFRKEILFADPVEVRVQEINQCFLNILTNAVLAVRDAEKSKILESGKGKIAIQTESALLHSAKAVKITISDNGIGMPSSVVSRIFEPFFTTRSVGHGRGLGLSEVYAIVNKHGGQIEIQSEEKQGTSVEMILPCRQEKIRSAP